MRKITRILIGSMTLVFACSLAPSSVLAVDVGELSNERIEYIRTHCVEAQSNLKQFQKSELVTRYVRGRSYEQILKQMTALNTRMATNRVSATELLQLTTEMQSSVAGFRTAYDQKYDKTLLAAIRLECQSKPAEFYNLIVSARTERAIVAVETERVTKVIAQYREAVVKAKGELPAQPNVLGR